GLPVFHILEPEIVDGLPPEVYAEQLQMAALTLDTDQIFDVVRRIRSQTAGV
ncbi:MAG: glycine/sarcosine/betaine reductase complex selenoprotein A, partial [Chloroflexi bacterium]|nr:glycine/sarcosine/betaine reductase complex selenoprotein A [Chloroflexota bacterium]